MFRRRRWPRVLAAVAVAAAIGVPVWLVTRDSPAPVADDPEIIETASPIPDPTPSSVALATVLAAPDAKLRTYAESTVQADGVNVLSVVGPSAAWIGDTPADRVLIVLVGADAKGFAFAAGTAMTFTGAVRAATADFGTALGLMGADSAEFARQGAYVEVTDYTVG